MLFRSLQGSDPQERLRQLFRDRDALYQAVASYAIDTGRNSVPSLVRLIRSQLELGGDLVQAPPPAP